MEEIDKVIEKWETWIKNIKEDINDRAKKTKNNRILNKKVHEIVKTKTKCCGEPAIVLILCPKCHSTMRIEQ